MHGSIKEETMPSKPKDKFKEYLKENDIPLIPCEAAKLTAEKRTEYFEKLNELLKKKPFITTIKGRKARMTDIQPQ